MQLAENVRESFKAIKANLLRTILTGIIVAVGIFALVGVLTAIEAIQNKINADLAGFGANSFDVSDISRRGTSQGKDQKTFPPITYKQLKKFKEVYSYPATVGLSSVVTQNAEIKRLSEKTNPNYWVYGGDANFIILKDYTLAKGRNFSELEVAKGSNVAIIGNAVAKTLFGEDEPVGGDISFSGRKFRVIGLLDPMGGVDSQAGGGDKQVIIPLDAANAMSSQRRLYYTLTASVASQNYLDAAIGEATGLMRGIRKDRPGDENSFEISKNDALTNALNNVTRVLRIAAFVIGFITLLGASIGLMNIMMVNVTERTREIGIRKALGATPLKIRQQFLIEAIVICLLGGVFGIIFGIVGGNLFTVLSQAGIFVIPWGWMIVGVIVCVAVGLISGYFPAYRASKLDPIESLRHE